MPFKKANHYFRLCQASLRHDMAKRIMYSILPAVSSPEQTQMTGGIIDYKSLEYAIEGYKDIIKYGVDSCVSELKNVPPERTRTYYDAMYKKDAGDYLGAIEICIDDFNNKEWDRGYGGEAWGKIAETLRDIILLGEEIEKTPPGQKKITTMQQMVIALNIFDGLSHNSDSILTNLVEKENLNKKEKERINNLIKIMDAKELANPIHVYKEIENTLKETGDIHKFKDWVTKLRSHPDYHKKSDNIYEKFQIRAKKLFIKPNRVFNLYLDKLKTKNSDYLFNADDIVAILSTYQFDIKSIIAEMERQYSDSEGINKIKNIDKNYDILLSSIVNIRDKMYRFKSVRDEDEDKLSELINQFINASMKLIYFIQSIF